MRLTILFAFSFIQTILGADVVVRVIDEKGLPVHGANLSIVFGRSSPSIRTGQSPWTPDRGIDQDANVRRTASTNAQGSVAISVGPDQSVLLCASKTSRLLVDNCVDSRPIYFLAGKAPASVDLALREGVKVVFRLPASLLGHQSNSHFSRPVIVLGVFSARGEFYPALSAEGTNWSVVVPSGKGLQASAASASEILALDSVLAERIGERAIVPLPELKPGSTHELTVASRLN